MALRAAGHAPDGPRGLVTAMILGIARVAGETAPVLFTAGNSTTTGIRSAGSRMTCPCACTS